MMNFPPAGISSLLPSLAALLTTKAELYAFDHGVVLDPTVPALVALDFNPSLTIAALAERSVPAIVARARQSGISARRDVAVPERS